MNNFTMKGKPMLFKEEVFKKIQFNRPKTVLITGASKGIGLATAERFAKENYVVYATARDPRHAYELQELAKKYPNVIIKQLDVTASEQKIKSIIDEIGRIDILVNNAGIGLYGPVETATDEQNRHVFDTNVFGLLKVTNAVLSDMRRRNSGSIITLSSVVGPLPDPYQPAYSASKAAVETYMAVLRKNLADAGYEITVCNVQPGPVLTHFEASTPNGARFSKEENPYPQMESGREKWKSIMQDGGRPVKETVDTIFKVAHEKSPPYWNQTNSMVKEEFEKIYNDTTGSNYMAGLSVGKLQAELSEDNEAKYLRAKL
jgi:NADP-dependent 3-hydroxy acid dehydrogenase YdfG